MIEPVVIVLRVAGNPAGQPRMRHALMRSKSGAAFVRGYTPKTADGWRTRVYLAALGSRPKTPHEGPVRVDTTWYFARPARLLKKSSPPGPIPYTAKPDRDNLDKATLDALTEAKVFRDDAQVYAGTIEKYYVEIGATPGAVIRITLEADA